MSDYYVDCEFDGHNGPLLSIALVPAGLGASLYVVTDAVARDVWVCENIVPLLDMGYRDDVISISVPMLKVGDVIHEFLASDESPTFHADSPVDIVRVLSAMSTSEAGGWRSCNQREIRSVVHNVDCWPNDIDGAIQHNAYWDALALKVKIEGRR